MDWISSAITAGGGLLSGLLGDKQTSKNRKIAQAQFDQQMDNTVARRVADAKRAGVHPLFALGTSPGASPTATISGQSGSGSFLGEGIETASRALGKALDPMQQAQMEAFKSESEKNFAQAAMFRSQAKRAEAEANSGPVRTFAATAPPEFRGKTPVIPRIGSKPSGAYGIFGQYEKNPYSSADQIARRANVSDEYAEFLDMINNIGEWIGRWSPTGAWSRASSTYQPLR